MKKHCRRSLRTPPLSEDQEKIASFRAGYGTILYLTDTETVHKLEKQFPSYAANFGPWAEQAIGGAQQAVWAALAEQEIGASLQHYNPLIDDAIHHIQPPCQLAIASLLRMPFGSINPCWKEGSTL